MLIIRLSLLLILAIGVINAKKESATTERATTSSSTTTTTTTTTSTTQKAKVEAKRDAEPEEEVPDRSKYGNIDYIDYKLVEANNFDYLNKNNVVIVAVSEDLNKDSESAIPVLNEFRNYIVKESEGTDENDRIKIVALNDRVFLNKYSVLKFPQVFYFRKGRYVLYKGKIDKKSLIDWFDETSEKLSHNLSDASFEHDTQAATGATTGHWFVLFHKKDCQTSLFLEPHFEAASLKLRNQVNFAYVNFDENPGLQERFNLVNSPTVLFFRGGLMFRYEFTTFDSDSIVSFTQKFYKNVKAEKVPIELGLFDKVTDKIVDTLKKQKIPTNYVYYGLPACLLFVIVLFIFIRCVRSRRNKRDFSLIFDNKEYYKLE